MSRLKKKLAIMAALAGTAFIAPMSSAQDVVNIANTKGVQESSYFASVKGWKVIVGTVNGQPAYCAAINNQAGSELRLGYDGGQWQMAVPYSSGHGEYSGNMDIDGRETGTYGESDGNWTFLWLNLGERDVLMNGQQVTIEVGKVSLDYDLTGAAAAVVKVEECVERSITASAAAPGGGSRQPETHSGGFEEPYARVDGWEIVRITKDAARKKFGYCAAWKITGSETGLRLATTDNDNSFGFSGFGSAAMGDTAPLLVWFDNDKASAESFEGRLVNDHNDYPWMMISESNDEVGLFVDAIRNYNRISFGYPVEGESHVESFLLNGTKTVVDRLIDCQDGR